MATSEGMQLIDVTYETERIDYSDDGVYRREASMQLLIDKAVADWLAIGGAIASTYVQRVESIVRNREGLCRGRYVEGSMDIKEVIQDGEAS